MTTRGDTLTAIESLLFKGLIEEFQAEDGEIKYRLTENGMRYKIGRSQHE